jgi:hypothetical protein
VPCAVRKPSGWAALRLWTEANTWFSSETAKKGQIMVGQLADAVLLSQDCFTVPDSDIVHIRSDLTLLGGRIVHGSGDYQSWAPYLPSVLPDWSPVAQFGGYARPEPAAVATPCGCAKPCGVHGHAHAAAVTGLAPTSDLAGFWGVFGCACWAV